MPITQDTHFLMFRVVLGLIIGMALLPTRALAEEAKAFTCLFKTGNAFSYEKTKFKREKTSPVTLDIRDIDAANQSARLVSGERTTQLRVIQAISAVHVLEVAGEGYLNITTIYARDARTGDYPAVHARHFGVLGQPIVSNYRGTCTPR